MNKSDKLRLYGQKDYTELIDFPVELVGKDGVVRRYTYEESLLVYAKRIESAHLRYRDPDVADAEVDHCRRRIDQIKRSWRHISSRKIGSAADYAVRDEESSAAECRSFIREYFGRALADRVSADEEPIPIYLSLIDHTGPRKVFHVSLANRKGAHLLYAFIFAWEPEKEGDPTSRAQFADWSRILATAPDSGDDVERLLAAREGKEFGFLLTGPASAAHPSALPDGDESASGEGASGSRGSKSAGGNATRQRIEAMLEDDPSNSEARYALGVRIQDEGDLPAALEEFKRCVELQPFYLEAYRRIALIGDGLKAHDDVEPYLLQALHYFPDDDRLHFHLGFLLAKQGRFVEARGALARALSLEPASRHAQWLLEKLDAHVSAGTDPRPDLPDYRAIPGSEPDPVETPAFAAHPPSHTATILLALALTVALAVRAFEPMAGTFVLAAIMAALIVHSARAPADPRSFS
jgi:tetratricopeptide (TPR) repeat protein